MIERQTQEIVIKKMDIIRRFESIQTGRHRTPADCRMHRKAALGNFSAPVKLALGGHLPSLERKRPLGYYRSIIVRKNFFATIVNSAAEDT